MSDITSVKEGFVVYDFYTYKAKSRELLRKVSPEIEKKTAEMGMTPDAIEGLADEEKEYVKQAAKENLTDPGSMKDLKALAKKLSNDPVYKKFSSAAQTRILAAFVILDFLAYKTNARKKLSPDTREAAKKLGMAPQAIKAGGGLDGAADKVVKSLGQKFLKYGEPESDRDLNELLQRDALIKSSLCIEDKSQCGEIDFKQFAKEINNAIKKDKLLPKLLKLIERNQDTFRVFLMPENRAAAVEVFLLASVLDSNDPQKLLECLKKASADAYEKVSERMKKYIGYNYGAEEKEAINKRDQEFIPDKKLYYAVKDLAQSINESVNVYVVDGTTNIEDVLREAENTFAWIIPYRRFQADVKLLEKGADFKTLLPQIIKHILDIPVEKERSDAIAAVRPMIINREIKSEEDCSWAESVVPLLSNNEFESLRKILEAKIKAFREREFKPAEEAVDALKAGIFKNSSTSEIAELVQKALSLVQKISNTRARSVLDARLNELGLVTIPEKLPEVKTGDTPVPVFNSPLSLSPGKRETIIFYEPRNNRLGAADYVSVPEDAGKKIVGAEGDKIKGILIVRLINKGTSASSVTLHLVMKLGDSGLENTVLKIVIPIEK